MIDIMKVLDFMRDTAPKYAEAKANLTYLEEYSRTLRSQLFFDALSQGHKTIAEREAYAFSHADYKAHILGLKQAVAACEALRWQLVAAETKAQCWRSMESSNRKLDRAAE